MKPEDHESLDQTDERLFDYLDGRLDAEAAQGMRMRLESDPEWKTRLENWTELQSAVRQSGVLSDDVKLPVGFADRVVDEAIRRARAEGYDDRHPLIMAGASAANVPASRTRRMPVTRVAMAMAAALMAVIGISVALRDNETTPSDPNFIAQSLVGPGSTTPASDDPNGTNRPGAASIVEAVRDGQPSSPDSGSMIASSAIEASISTNQKASISTSGSKLADHLAKSGSNDDSSASGDPNSLPNRDTVLEVADASDSADKLSVPPSSMVGIGENDAAAEALGAVLVVEVQCRSGIRGDLLIRDAMRASGMSVAKQHKISDELFEVAADASGVPDEVAFEMIYVSATTSRFQQLYATLMSDTQAVRSVGLSLATDAPIVQAVQSASSVAAVRSGEVAVPIIVRKESGVVDSMDGLRFIPVGKPSDLTAMSGGVTGPAARGGTAPAGSLEGDEAAQAILIAR